MLTVPHRLRYRLAFDHTLGRAVVGSSCGPSLAGIAGGRLYFPVDGPLDAGGPCLAAELVADAVEARGEIRRLMDRDGLMRKLA